MVYICEVLAASERFIYAFYNKVQKIYNEAYIFDWDKGFQIHLIMKILNEPLKCGKDQQHQDYDGIG